MSQSIYSITKREDDRLPDKHQQSTFWPSKPERVAPGAKATTILTNLQRGNIPTQNITTTYISDIYQRAGQGDLHARDLEHYLRETGGQIDMPDNNGLSLLMWAAAYGQSPTVQLLINHGANVNQVGMECESPLHLAASNGSHDMVSFLVRAGAAVDAVDENACTALMFAAINNHPHAANELLVNGADYTCQNINGDRAYNLAVKYGSRACQTVLENNILAALGQPRL